MLKKMLMKQAIKSQLGSVPEAQRDMILDLVERNPEFFEKLASELQDGMRSGRPQEEVLMNLMDKYKSELTNLVSSK
jgi:HPt (histidine-containing phosphotransfer) domain-containing protein